MQKYEVKDHTLLWVGPEGKEAQKFSLTLECYKEWDASCQGFKAIIGGEQSHEGWKLSLKLEHIGSNLYLRTDERDITLGQVVDWVNYYIGVKLYLSEAFKRLYEDSDTALKLKEQMSSYLYGVWLPDAREGRGLVSTAADNFADQAYLEAVVIGENTDWAERYAIALDSLDAKIFLEGRKGEIPYPSEKKTNELYGLLLHQIAVLRHLKQIAGESLLPDAAAMSLSVLCEQTSESAWF